MSDDGCTILRPSASATIADVLELTLKKRALRVGVDYVLETKAEPGRPLDPALKLAALMRPDGRALEFKVGIRGRELAGAGAGFGARAHRWVASCSPPCVCVPVS